MVSCMSSKVKYANRPPSTKAIIEHMKAYGYQGFLMIDLVSSALSRLTKVMNMKSTYMADESMT